MLDQNSAQVLSSRERETEIFDLAVVGAGIAGLNALFAAAQYLPRSARMCLIDRKPAAGGMWNSTYDYVRLHQPHPMFTVGNIRWDWEKPYTYLAEGTEVREHLAAALRQVSRSTNLETRFGHTVTACEEVRTDAGSHARITLHPNDRPEAATTLEARRAFHASGLDLRQPEPLTFSSDRVISTVPQQFRQILAANPGAPVYVVGGGKTGMDTVLFAAKKDPGRDVHLINGRGTNFLNRTKYLPSGLKRWTSGELVSRLFRDIALHFDGDNEEHTIGHFRQHHSTDPDSNSAVFLYGLQSQEETAMVADLARIRAGYLADVRDAPDGPVMMLRDGYVEPVSPGSIFVNCSGSFFRGNDLAAYAPCLSPHDAVVSINPRDSFHFLTGVAGFFLPHLLYRGLLRGKGFYTMDLEALFRENRNAWTGATAAQAYMNQVIAIRSLPMMLLNRCGLDLDRWYPLPRRVAGLIRMRRTADADIAHCRAALDRVANRFGIRSAPLE